MLCGASPSGGFTKCEIGSAAPQNTRPMPMPAANSIDIQLALEKSGSASSPPMRSEPKRPKARYIRNDRVMNTTSRYSQPVLRMMVDRPLWTTSLKGPGARPAISTSSATSAMEMRNTMQACLRSVGASRGLQSPAARRQRLGRIKPVEAGQYGRQWRRTMRNARVIGTLPLIAPHTALQHRSASDVGALFTPRAKQLGWSAPARRGSSLCALIRPEAGVPRPSGQG